MKRMRKVLPLAALTLWAAGCAPAPVPPPPGGPVFAPFRGMLFGPIGFLTSLFVLAAIALVIVVAWTLLHGRSPSNRFPGVPEGSTAKKIVQERYARGEISREEYWQLMRDLEDSGHAQPAQ